MHSDSVEVSVSLHSIEIIVAIAHTFVCMSMQSLAHTQITYWKIALLWLLRRFCVMLAIKALIMSAFGCIGMTRYVSGVCYWINRCTTACKVYICCIVTVYISTYLIYYIVHQLRACSVDWCVCSVYIYSSIWSIHFTKCLQTPLLVHRMSFVLDLDASQSFLEHTILDFSLILFNVPLLYDIEKKMSSVRVRNV